MDSRNPLDCAIFDLAGKEWKVPHKFVHGCCVRCGELEPREEKRRIGKYSGKSKTPYGGYESR